MDWFPTGVRPATPLTRPQKPTGPTTPSQASRAEQALGTSAFWLLLLYTVLVYPVQAGVSLHQAAHLIERGIEPTVAATIVSTFSLMSAVASIACGLLPRWTADPLSAGADRRISGCQHARDGSNIVDGDKDTSLPRLFGFGIGGVLTLLPIAWADYFGRANFAAIRSIALSVQVIAQAAGPLFSGALHDWTGSYQRSLQCFAVLSCLSVVSALTARRPQIATIPPRNGV